MAPKAFYGTQVWHRLFKPEGETRHWLALVQKVMDWYEGKQPFTFPFPPEEKKEKRFDLERNALLTYIRAENEHGSYLKDLGLESDAFEGMRVGDIGSGPFPTLLVFSGCERYCIDPLLDTYRWFGFPVDEFESDIHFINASAEALPLPDAFFDAIISRDALDHVTNFHKAAAEIKRVLRPNGLLHLLVNCHAPTATEPLQLTDKIILEEFACLGIEKTAEHLDAWGFPGGKTVLWSNRAHRLQGEAGRAGLERNRTDPTVC